MLAASIDNAGGTATFGLTLEGSPEQAITDGIVVKVFFNVLAGASGTCDLDLAVDSVKDAYDRDVVATVSNGTLTIGGAGGGAGDGDVNGDGSVDITDARWAAEYAIGIRTLTAAQIAAADVAPPPGVDITDARWIAEAAIGLRTLSVMAVVPTGRVEPASIEVNAFGELTVSGTNAELADLQGTLYFDPDEVRITSVSGLNGFEVLASEIDNEAGYVRFAAAKLSGGMITGGPILAFETSDDASVGLLNLDVLRDAKGQDIPFEVLNGDVTDITGFGCYPNPVTDVHTTTFEVKGAGAALVSAIKVEIYDLAGRMIYSSGEVDGTSFDWHTENAYGEYLANGVYLYRMYAEVAGRWVLLGVEKLAVLR